MSEHKWTGLHTLVPHMLGLHMLVPHMLGPHMMGPHMMEPRTLGRSFHGCHIPQETS